MESADGTVLEGAFHLLVFLCSRCQSPAREKFNPQGNLIARLPALTPLTM
jgi:hypothetical protein